MAREQRRTGVLERTAGFMERLNYALGATALAGAVVFESAVLAGIGVLQFAEGAVWKWLKDRRAGTPKVTNPKIAMAAG